ncbi:hypothetical protein OSTOST_06251 [Ostertagia ostertagi]
MLQVERVRSRRRKAYVDEDDVGGFWELAKEGFGSAFATFMVAWITVYSAVYQSFVTFVILGQRSAFDNLKTSALKDSISQQAEILKENVEIVVPHVDFPDIVGFWASWPLFSRISKLVTSQWYVFLESESVVDASTLFSFLKGFDPTKKTFLGHGLYDKSPTIIHHFYGHDRDGDRKFLFPDFAAGFVLSGELLTSLAAAMNTSAAKATDTFTIDAKHELSLLILRQCKTSLESYPDWFCNRKEITCTDEPLIKPQDIFVGVKTFSEYHTTRIPVIKRTWSAHLPFIEYFSDLVNNVIPTVDSGVPNTERGHCSKTFVILKRFVDLLDADVNSQKFLWLLISDDDTLISIPRLLRLLSCYDSNEKIIIGERYGYGFSSFGATGYDYPTGGAGMVFSPSAARAIVSSCACPADDAPDDMIIGMCSQRNGVAIIHNSAFHQARPIDYPDQYIRRLSPISFHKFEDIDPYEVYMEYLFRTASISEKDRALAFLTLLSVTMGDEGEPVDHELSSKPALSADACEGAVPRTPPEEEYESSGTTDDSSRDGDSLHIDDELQDSTLAVPTSSFAVDNTDGDGKLHRPLQILWSKLRKLGCVVDAAQVKPTRRKLKCYVDRCVYKGGPFDSLQLRCTLPPKVELAIQWICVCVSDISRQNDFIIKFINHLEKGADESSPPIQTATREQLISFPFRVCCRHFSTEPDHGAIPVAPIYHLPGKLSISREEMLSKLRRRYLFLSEMGYEDLEIDKLEPNGVLPLPTDGTISCDVPGCRYKSSDISIFTGRLMKMFSVPANSVDHGKWRIAVQMGLGLPSSFDFPLKEGAHICEMHFTEGKRYSRGVMKDPYIFRRLTVEGINPSLSRLGALCLGQCAVNSCTYSEEDTICVPFPKSRKYFQKDPLYSRWIVSLSEADESFQYGEGLTICFRHFSMAANDGLVPSLHLGNEAKLDHPRSRSTMKRRVADDTNKSEGSGESSCCVENKNILAIVERMEIQSRAVERLVLHLNSMCRSGFVPTDGTLERKVKFQLFDILSELSDARTGYHLRLRLRIDEAVRYEGERQS